MAIEMRIVGQGIAGSLLGWCCERAGVDFTIEDPFVDAAEIGNAAKAPPLGFSSAVGAGIINPITGQRLVKSWRIDSLLPLAVAMYREIGDALGESFLFSYRLRRLFANDRERTVAFEKWARSDFAGFGESIDDAGLWIAPAYRVDLARLVQALRVRWLRSGHWRNSQNSSMRASALTVRCLGPGELSESLFNWTGLRPAKGELIEIETRDALDRETIRNCHEWLMPLSDHRALVGATFEPGVASIEPTKIAASILHLAAERLLGSKGFQIISQRAGVRVVTSDKHPVIGRHPEDNLLGIFNGLGSKGALLAPWLAQNWIADFTRGQSIDPAVDASRCWPPKSVNKLKLGP